MKNAEEYKFDIDKTLFDGMDPIKLGLFPTSSEPGMSFPKSVGASLITLIGALRSMTAAQTAFRARECPISF